MSANSAVGEPSCRRNILSANCPVDEISCQRTVLAVNCPVGELSGWRAVFRRSIRISVFIQSRFVLECTRQNSSRIAAFTLPIKCFSQTIPHQWSNEWKAGYSINLCCLIGVSIFLLSLSVVKTWSWITIETIEIIHLHIVIHFTEKARINMARQV